MPPEEVEQLLIERATMARNRDNRGSVLGQMLVLAVERSRVLDGSR